MYPLFNSVLMCENVHSAFDSGSDGGQMPWRFGFSRRVVMVAVMPGRIYYLYSILYIVLLCP